ncbi:MAG: PHP domain-containing protein [Treponema sp.]|nr:PHP domain-containing protein [Treponema sp.]
MIDLHSHSTASDGTFTPRELVKYAAEKKLKVLALTDHDTTDGLMEAQQEAKVQGITFVPGIEINIAWPTGEFHLLGLGLKKVSQELKDTIEFLKDGRIQRNVQMIEKLRQEGIDITLEELQQRFNANTLGRPHFAQLLVEKGIVKVRQQAFDQFFAKGRPCFVDREGASLTDAVKAIKSSGGIPVQAHPLSMYVSWGKLEDKIIEIQQSGVQGLEAWHPGARVAEAERLEEMAHKLGMIATAGSDFHGVKVRADRHIGETSGAKKIDDRFWEEELKPALLRIHGDDDLTFTD